MRGAGRPIAFDREEVVERAVEQFWTAGFDGTSLDDLVRHLGISRSTLYNSFNGKEGLYATAIDLYMQRIEQVFVERLQHGTGGIDDLVAFAELLKETLASKNTPVGCLVLNWIDTPRNSTAGSQFLTSLCSGLDAALHRAVVLGEIEADAATTKAATLTAAVLGLNTAENAAASGLDVVDPTALVDGLIATITEWRRP